MRLAHQALYGIYELSTKKEPNASCHQTPCSISPLSTSTLSIPFTSHHSSHGRWRHLLHCPPQYKPAAAPLSLSRPRTSLSRRSVHNSEASLGSASGSGSASGRRWHWWRQQDRPFLYELVAVVEKRLIVWRRGRSRSGCCRGTRPRRPCRCQWPGRCYYKSCLWWWLVFERRVVVVRSLLLMVVVPLIKW